MEPRAENSRPCTQDPCPLPLDGGLPGVGRNQVIVRHVADGKECGSRSPTKRGPRRRQHPDDTTPHRSSCPPQPLLSKCWVLLCGRHTHAPQDPHKPCRPGPAQGAAACFAVLRQADMTRRGASTRPLWPWQQPSRPPLPWVRPCRKLAPAGRRSGPPADP